MPAQGDSGSVFIVSRRRLHFAATPCSHAFGPAPPRRPFQRRLRPGEQAITQNVTVDAIRRGNFSGLLTAKECRRLKKLDWKSRIYNSLRHPTNRGLRSGDFFSIWRSDFERVNGFDENFCGWGGEDDDLGWRLRRAACAYIRSCDGLFVSPVASDRSHGARQAKAGRTNARYQWREGKLICCRNGLVKRGWNDLAVRIPDNQRTACRRAHDCRTD